MTDQSTSNCSIWPEYPTRDIRRVGNKNVWRITSPRAGGQYVITGLADKLLEQEGLTEIQKVRLTTRLINHGRQTGWPLLIREREVEEARVAGDFQVPDRAHRLMELFRHGVVGKEIILFSQGGQGTPPTMEKIGQMALAWSESTTAKDLMYLCGDLAKKGWIEVKSHPTDPRFGVVMS